MNMFRPISCILTCVALTCAVAVSGCGSPEKGSSAGSSTESSTTKADQSSTKTAPADSLSAPTVAGTIAFTSLVAEGDYDVCVVDTGGSRLTTIAGGVGCQMYPRWSPDGTRIAFAQSVPGDVDPQDVWVMNADGSGRKQLTNGPIRNLHPAWSPDGTQIAYTGWTDAEERAAVFVMNADGSGARAVTSKDGQGVDYWPMWGSDGKIYFSRVGLPGKPSAAYRVNPDGSGLELVRTLGDAHLDFFDYGLSPDGGRVALQDVGTDPDRLVIVPTGGSGTPLTLLDPVSGYLARSVADADWSPDGKALAIAALYDTGFTRIYVVNADGSGLSVVPGVDSARDPDWRPK